MSWLDIVEMVVLGIVVLIESAALIMFAVTQTKDKSSEKHYFETKEKYDTLALECEQLKAECQELEEKLNSHKGVVSEEDSK